MPDQEGISAIVTAFRRVEQTLDTLRRLEACHPQPNEILVHVDGNETACVEAVRRAMPHSKIITSQTRVGPGGGRNKLIKAVRNDVVASFDDDSYPTDRDYFARAMALARQFPNAALMSASIYHRNEPCPSDVGPAREVASFGAGGAVFRRQKFLDAGGFVPLAVAYGMEEEDLALRVLDLGGSIIASPSLRVFHDSDLAHHGTPTINAGAIANVALLAALRYPKSYWPYGALQVGNRVIWCLRHGRTAGVVSGLASIPAHIWRHRHLRRPVSVSAMKRRADLRKSSFLDAKIGAQFVTGR
jgi:GT2 family glycosyltransferase